MPTNARYLAQAQLLFEDKVFDGHEDREQQGKSHAQREDLQQERSPGALGRAVVGEALQIERQRRRRAVGREDGGHALGDQVLHSPKHKFKQPTPPCA